MSVKLKVEAWFDLLRRYKDTWIHYWKIRHQISLPDLMAHESDFLPAALSIQSQPVSPTGRWVAKILMFVLLALLVWSFFGKIDIIVNAQGKIIPSGYSKTIASVETASISRLYVSEGQSVKEGDLLIELDARAIDSDHRKAEGEVLTAWLQAERSRALLEAYESGKAPLINRSLANAPLMTEGRWRDSQQHVIDQWQDYQAKLTRLEGEILRYSQAIPLAAQRASDYAELAKTNDVSQHAWLEKKQSLIDARGQLTEVINQKNALKMESRKTAHDAMNEANRLMTAAMQDSSKATAQSDLHKLNSPVDGTVQQLTVHTEGGVVSAAQPLMQIIPTLASIEMESFMENKDVGFVHAGQDAQVKIDAFEYTKYGTIAAKVNHVSRDAIQDEKRGLIFAVKVTLMQPKINVNGREVALTPGMSGSVEIKTGERRVIEYVLAPLLQHGRESLNER